MKIRYILLVQVFLALGNNVLADNDIEPGKELYTAIRAEAPIVLDGDLSEWPDADVVANPKFSTPKGSGGNPRVDGELVHFETWNGGVWTGLDDHASMYRVVYNDDNVYLSVVVTDDYHENSANSSWNGDSIQLMIANDSQDYRVALYNYALGGVEDNIGEIIVQHEARPADGSDTEAFVSRNTETKQTVYEIRFPKSALDQNELSAGLQFGLGILINDGDEDTPGQKGWSGWGANAIVHGKSPEETALITLGPAPIALNIRPELDPANENTTIQMVGQVIFSDHTTRTLAGSDLEWSKIEGPISTIDGDGKAALMEVADDTRATIVGSYRNVRSSLSFTVADVPAVLAFGNQDLIDSDRDGQSDSFELLAGYRPEDPEDFFDYHIKRDLEGFQIELSKVVPGTRYIIEASTDTRIYSKAATIDPQETETNFIFHDPSPFARTKFYRIRLESTNIAK